MSRPKLCPDCGSSDIVEDSHYSQQQMVCAECGYVLTEGALTTTLSEEGFLQAVKYSESSGQNENISKAKLKGIIRVRNLCRVLRLPDSFVGTAVSYYERIFPHPICHSVSKEKKEAIMGCCVYITCRQHRWPITMGTVCTLMYSQKELFSSMLPKLVEALRIDLPTFDLRHLVESHCKRSKKGVDEKEKHHRGKHQNIQNVMGRSYNSIDLKLCQQIQRCPVVIRCTTVTCWVP